MDFVGICPELDYPSSIMSLHAKPSPEAIERLRKQRRNSSIFSILTAVFTVAIAALALGMFLLPSILQESPVIVTYPARERPEDLQDEKKVQTKIERNPSRPPTSMAKVIVANTMSPTAIQVPDVEVSTPSLDFGAGNDFGDAWGSGDGFGNGGGEVTFFNQTAKGERVAYVIDYSQSMRGQREKLMREELTKSVSKLPPGVQYQLIFFAGPAWVAGDEVTMAGGNKSAVVKSGGRKFDWVSNGGAHGWEPKGRNQKAGWIEASSLNLKKSTKLIKETNLVWGTTWEPALDIAFDMDPPPQLVFFMTDGMTGGNMKDVTRKISSRARSKGIVVNTVAMMEPKAMESMKEIAKKTGGQFTIIEQSGKARQMPLD